MRGGGESPVTRKNRYRRWRSHIAHGHRGVIAIMVNRFIAIMVNPGTPYAIIKVSEWNIPVSRNDNTPRLGNHTAMRLVVSDAGETQGKISYFPWSSETVYVLVVLASPAVDVSSFPRDLERTRSFVLFQAWSMRLRGLELVGIV